MGPGEGRSWGRGRPVRITSNAEQLNDLLRLVRGAQLADEAVRALPSKEHLHNYEMDLQKIKVVEIRATELDLSVAELDHEIWNYVPAVKIARYWSGELAPPLRHAEARLISTPSALLIRFEATQNEPLIVCPTPETKTKTIGLWDRDVCEIFIAPNAAEPNCYFEFEAAPTGEWVDLAIRLNEETRETDWDFRSGMTTAARVEANKILIAMRIPWTAQIPKPSIGDEWLGNLCRCIGEGEERGYLAWQPTYTDKANFHVPEVFGTLRFSELIYPPARD